MLKLPLSLLGAVSVVFTVSVSAKQQMCPPNKPDCPHKCLPGEVCPEKPTPKNPEPTDPPAPTSVDA